ncbi:T9SS type A sorting domain-containing protein [Bacteroidota bacterium]
MWKIGLTTYISGPTKYLVNSNTIADNEADPTGSGEGGGVYFSVGSGSTVYGVFNNNIIYYNSANVDNNVSANLTTGSYSRFEYCDLEGCSGTGTGNIDQNPQFHGSGDYRLNYGFPTSPCLDIGDSTKNITSVDLDNTDRIQYGQIDMGCYEHDHIYYIYFPSSVNKSTEQENHDMEIIWNMAQDEIGLKFNVDDVCLISMIIYDMSGKVVYKRSSSFFNGNHSIFWDLDNLSKGIYLVNFVKDEHEILMNTKIIIQ